MYHYYRSLLVNCTIHKFIHIHLVFHHRCFSFVGRIGGEQRITLGPACAQKGIVMHEIFHALGRWHEHNRPDRQLHVIINTDNIMPG